MGGTSVLLPPSLIKFRQLLHLNQAGVKYFISNLTDAQASTLCHGHKGALEVRVDGSTEYWAFLIVVTELSMAEMYRNRTYLRQC